MNYILKNVSKVNKENLFSFLVALVLITIPFPFIINSLAIVLFLGVALGMLLLKRLKPEKKLNKISILLMSIYLLGAFSYLWSVDRVDTLSGMSSFISYFLLPVGFYIIQDLKINRRKILYAFAVVILLINAYCFLSSIFNYFKFQNFEFLFYHNFSENFNNLNAIYLSVFTVVALAVFIFQNHKKAFDYFSLIFLIICLLLLSSKTVIFSGAIMFVMSLLIYRSKKAYKKKWILLISFVVILSSFNIIKRFALEFERTNVHKVLTTKEFGWDYVWSGSGIRILQFRTFYDLAIKDKMYLSGYGLKASSKRIAEQHKEYKIYSKMIGINFHNQYLQILSELGILGFLFLAVIFFMSLKKAVLHKDVLFLLFLFLIVFVCFTESFLWRQRGMVLFISLLLLFYNTPKKIKLNNE